MSNKNEKLNNSMEESFSDEISILDILIKINKNKRNYLKMIIIAILSWIFVSVIYVFLTSPTYYYSIVIRYNFPQAINGFYPNGNPLNPTDILSGNVLESSWTTNQLEKRGIALKEFLSNVYVEPYSQTFDSADKKYKTLLNQKNLSRTDIESIEANYKQEIISSSKQNVRITFRTTQNIDSDVAEKVLNDIVTNWSTAAKDKLGVLRRPISSSSLLEPGMKSAKGYQVIDYLISTISQIDSLLKMMANDPTSNSLRDPKSGLNLSELSIRLIDIKAFGIGKLQNSASESATASSADISAVTRRLDTLRDEQEIFIQQAKSYQQSFIDYVGQQSTQRKSADVARINPNQIQSDTSGSNVQLSGDAVNKIIDVVQNSKDAQFKQELINKRISAENESINLSSRIRDQERLLAQMTTKSTHKSISYTDFQSQLDEVWGDLTLILNAMSNIQSQAQSAFIGNSGLLYTTVEPITIKSPEKSQVHTNILILFPIFILIALFLGTVQALVKKI